jgi:tape measure domain-containing protein
MPNSQTYTLNIVVQGDDKASGPIGKAGGALGNIGQIAAGIVASKAFMAIAEGILNSGRAALQATADYQMMEVGISALLAREISRGTTTSQLAEQRVNLTDKERLKIFDLQKSYDGLSQELATTQARYDEVAQTQGANSEAALTLKVKLNSLNSEMGSTNFQLADLKDKADGATLALQQITTGTMSVADAMPQAEAKAKELLKQIRTLAIQSPYELDQVQQTLKLGMAFGLSSDQAMSFTKGIMTMAAGVGANNEQMGRMSYNLAQIRMQGKVTAMDVRQLAMAGLDLTGALQGIGTEYGVQIKTTDDFNKAIASGALTWEQFATGFEKYADKNFGNAAQRLSMTWSGMMSNFHDVFALSMPAVMGPALEKVTKFLNGFMAKFVDFTNSGKLEEWGQKIGDAVGTVIGWFEKADAATLKIQRFFDLLKAGYSFDLATQLGFGFRIPPEVKAFEQGVKDAVGGVFTYLEETFGKPVKITSFDDLKNKIREFGSMMGGDFGTNFEKVFGIKIPPEVVRDIQSLISFVGRVKQVFEDAKPVLDSAFDKMGEFWAKNGPGISSSIEGISKKISEIRADSFQKVTEIAAWLYEKIIPFLTKELDRFSQWFVANGPLIQSFMEKMKDEFGKLQVFLSGVFMVIGEALKLVWNIISPILSMLFAILGDLVKFIMALVTGDWQAAWAALGSIVMNVLNGAIQAAVNFVGTILSWFGVKFKAVNNTWSENWTIIKNFVVDLWEKIKTGITTKFTEIKTGIETFLKDAIQKVKDKFGEWKQAGTDMIQGFFNSIKTKIEEVKSWLKGAWDDIVKTAKNILGIKSPSTVFAGIGENLMLGMAKGIGDGLQVPVTAMVNASGKMSQIMPGLLSNSTSTVTSYSSPVTIYVSGAGDPDAVASSIYEKLTGQGVKLRFS